jgi:hypothetical protein
MEAIENAFSKIGSRVRVRPFPTGRRSVVPPLGRNGGVAAPSCLQVNVSKDGKGEFFQITLNEPVALQVMNMDRVSNHLLLFARDTHNEKYRYLCGQDERGLFAAAVPSAVSSVVAAMEALKPEPVIQSQVGMTALKRNKRKNSAFRRQGEWYFVPEPDLNPDRKFVRLNEPIRRGRSRPHIVEELFRHGGETVYVCRKHPNGLPEKAYRRLLQENPAARYWGWTIMRRNMDVFGRGKVTHPDHKTIVLSGWHRIFPNRESDAWFIETLVFLD